MPQQDRKLTQEKSEGKRPEEISRSLDLDTYENYAAQERQKEQPQVGPTEKVEKAEGSPSWLLQNPFAGLEEVELAQQQNQPEAQIQQEEPEEEEDLEGLEELFKEVPRAEQPAQNVSVRVTRREEANKPQELKEMPYLRDMADDIRVQERKERLLLLNEEQHNVEDNIERQLDDQLTSQKAREHAKQRTEKAYERYHQTVQDDAADALRAQWQLVADLKKVGKLISAEKVIENQAGVEREQENQEGQHNFFEKLQNLRENVPAGSIEVAEKWEKIIPTEKELKEKVGMGFASSDPDSLEEATIRFATDNLGNLQDLSDEDLTALYGNADKLSYGGILDHPNLFVAIKGKLNKEIRRRRTTEE